MKKLILSLSVGALLCGTSAMAFEEEDVHEAMSLMAVNGETPIGCLGYGAGIFAVNGVLTVSTSRHGRKLTTTCTIPLSEDHLGFF